MAKIEKFSEESKEDCGYGRRSSDNRNDSRLNSVGSVAAILVVAGGVVIWVTSAFISEETKPIVKTLITHDAAILHCIQDRERMGKDFISLRDEMHKGFNRLNDKFDDLQSVILTNRSK